MFVLQTIYLVTDFGKTLSTVHHINPFVCVSEGQMAFHPWQLHTENLHQQEYAGICSANIRRNERGGADEINLLRWKSARVPFEHKVILFIWLPAFGYHCDFESGLCGWQNDVANAAGCGWTLRKGLAATLETGPFFDHTYETPNGSFLYFQSGYCRQITDRGLVSANLPLRGFSQGPICVKFWYLMYGTGNGYNLAVRTKHKTGKIRP